MDNLEIVSAFFCLVSFAWATQWFFKRDTKRTVRQRLSLATMYIIAFMHLYALIFKNSSVPLFSAIAISMYVISGALFWWTIYTAKSRRFKLIFETEGPECLVQDGPYRYIRHPFYTSYILCWLAGIVATGWIWLVPPSLMAYLIYLRAINEEERRFLSSPFASNYRRYKAKTGRMLPRIPFRRTIRRWFRRFNNYWDYFTNRFNVVVLSGKEYQRVLNLRKEVFGEELNRADRDSKISPGNSDKYDAHSFHLLCVDLRSMQDVGCVRLTPAVSMLKEDHLVKEYSLDVYPDELLSSILVASRLSVRREYRNKVVSLSLILKCYEVALKRLGTAVCNITCEPGLVSLYAKLGWKAFGHVLNSGLGGYRVPMYIVLDDYQHLRSVKSPLMQVAKRLSYPVNGKGLAWEREYLRQREREHNDFSIVTRDTASRLRDLMGLDLSEESACDLLAEAALIDVKSGDVVIAESDGGKEMACLLSGTLTVKSGETKIAELHEGDIFGEMAPMLLANRSASVVAENGPAKVLILKPNALEKIRDEVEREYLIQKLTNLAKNRLPC